MTIEIATDVDVHRRGLWEATWLRSDLAATMDQLS